MTGWYPLNVREAGNHESYDALAEGVPEWIRDPLLTVALTCFVESWPPLLNRPYIDRCGIDLRVRIPSDSGQAFVKWLGDAAIGNPSLFLAVLDWLVRTGDWKRRNEFEDILSAGGSVWTISGWGVDEWGEQQIGLVRRVDATATVAVAQVISAKTASSQHLAEAWQAAYGLNGDPSRAYTQAIKAVEFAAIPVVTPNNHNATLSNVIGEMRSNDDWIVPLTREKTSGHVASTVLAMVEMLWKGQSDRHGSTRPPVPITPEAAQAAVLMATTLVQWFQSGAVQRGSV